MSAAQRYDAIMVGGGFYGCIIALYLARRRGFSRILLLEQESELLARASFHNQARIHGGYHYPRSLTTALRSRINLPRFMSDWPQAVVQNLTMLYAVARQNSKVTARQYERFCREVGAPLSAAPGHLSGLFTPQLVEAVFLAEEHVFNAMALRKWASEELQSAGVTLRLGTRAHGLRRAPGGGMTLTLNGPPGAEVHAPYVFNCSYAGLNGLSGDFPRISTPLKHELTEMTLLEVPNVLRDVGITMMDGPFFSLMPFPARGLHTLSHVRYTPHHSWQDDATTDPYEALRHYDRHSRGSRMLRDASRYLPMLASARQQDSLFEIKTVLVKNEGDDGRPILFERHETAPGCYSILGGKIDNVYDVLEKLEHEHFDLRTSA